MAIAVSAPSFERSATRSEAQAATWTGLSAGVSVLATIPLVWMLASPISKNLFVRGSEHDGSWSYVFMVTMIVIAPATYALFFGTAGELLKTRVAPHVHKTTMRIAAMGMVPYLVMATLALYWDGGPQQALLTAAGLSVPIAVAATIWASAQQH